MSIRFEWDPAKNDANQRKHGLRFEDAKPISIAPIAFGLITVVWTEPVDDLVRIISVRPSSKRERERYRQYKAGFFY